MGVTIFVRGPEWFFGLDSILEGFAAIVLLLVAIVSWKAFKFTKDKRYRSFSLAFGLMTLGMISRAVTDIVLHQKLCAIEEVFLAGYIVYIFATLISLVMLFALTLKTKDRAPLIALILISLVLVLLSSSYFLTFHAIAFILLAFITFHFIRNCVAKKTLSAGFVAAAFLLMTIAQVQFVVDMVWHRWYILGNIALLIAFLLLLITLIKVLKPAKIKLQKKRK